MGNYTVETLGERGRTTENPARWGIGDMLVLPEGDLIACQRAEVLWDVYSKGWHRTYGPVRRVTDRWIMFRRCYQEGVVASEFEKLCDLDSWRGKWQRRVLEMIGVNRRLYNAYIVRAKFLEGGGKR